MKKYLSLLITVVVFSVVGLLYTQNSEARLFFPYQNTNTTTFAGALKASSTLESTGLATFYGGFLSLASSTVSSTFTSNGPVFLGNTASPVSVTSTNFTVSTSLFAVTSTQFIVSSSASTTFNTGLGSFSVNSGNGINGLVVMSSGFVGVGGGLAPVTQFAVTGNNITNASLEIVPGGTPVIQSFQRNAGIGIGYSALNIDASTIIIRPAGTEMWRFDSSNDLIGNFSSPLFNKGRFDVTSAGNISTSGTLFVGTGTSQSFPSSTFPVQFQTNINGDSDIVSIGTFGNSSGFLGLDWVRNGGVAATIRAGYPDTAVQGTRTDIVFSNNEAVANTAMTEILRLDGFGNMVFTSTSANRLGTFAVRSGGNVFASGSLQVAGNTSVSGFISVSGTLFASSTSQNGPAVSASTSGYVVMQTLPLSITPDDSVCIENSGVLSGFITQNRGAVTCTVSSRKYKHDILPLSGLALDEVMQLKPVEFKKNGTDVKEIGFIAEDVLKVEPRLVFFEPGSTTDTRGVKYENVTALLAKAIQELKTIVYGIMDQVHHLVSRADVQQQKIQQLEERLNALEHRK